MKIVPKKAQLPPNSTLLADGSVYARVFVGASGSPTRLEKNLSFPAGTWTYESIEKAQAETRAELKAQRAPRISKGSVAADCRDYKTLAPLRVQLSKAMVVRRGQQHDFWCAQLVKLGAPVLTVAQVKAGERLEGRTFGDIPRVEVGKHLDRIREILASVWPATDDDPYAGAGTSNHYKGAFSHLFTVLDHDKPEAINPIERIAIRTPRPPVEKGQDMRVVVLILKHLKNAFGRDNLVTRLRAAVLAWMHITPIQLQRMTNPAKAFHDIPDASREQMVEGDITVTVPVRYKGRQKVAPVPQIIPLVPQGVAALRAFVAEPEAWGAFSLSSMNKALARACAATSAELKAAGVTEIGGERIDYETFLKDFTVYHFKSSFATVASVATGGMLDADGNPRESAAVQSLLHHGDAKTTAHYTQKKATPLRRQGNLLTARYLATLLRQPLTPTPAIVAKKKTA